MAKKRLIKICAVLLSALLLVAPETQTVRVSAAKSISQLKKELAENTKKKQDAINEKTKKQAEFNSISDKKSDLDIQISALQSDINAIDSVISQKEQEIADKTKKIDEITVQIGESKQLLKERMKVMYESGGTSYLEMLFESKGLSDLFTRIAVIQDIVEHDRNLIDEYAAARTEIEEARTVVETERSEQQEAKDLLVEKKADIKDKQAEYNKLLSELQNEVAELEKFAAENEKYEAQARAELQKAMEEAEKAERAKAQKQKNSSSNTTTATAAKVTSGEFGWPSASSTRVTSEFSPNRKNPVTGVWRAHKGMDIGAPKGSNVLASKDGTVVTAKWNNGYGYYITINHGGGVATLYAHNSELLVKAGDTVKKGQVIAKVGSTGNSTGPHIHFEVIINGVQQNPRNYL